LLRACPGRPESGFSRRVKIDQKIDPITHHVCAFNLHFAFRSVEEVFSHKTATVFLKNLSKRSAVAAA